MSIAPPEDRRGSVLDAVIRRHHARADALVAVLHKAQDLFGYLDKPVLRHIARSLRLPPSRVQGVATFYHLFRLKPPGRHACMVCTGTACFVKGANQLLEAAERTCGVGAGNTTQDGCVSLGVVRCTGTCGLAPLAVLDEEVVGPLSPEGLAARVREWMNGPR
jgi:bidirectional [NiFe] hydrogenase diaphorase subunit